MHHAEMRVIGGRGVDVIGDIGAAEDRPPPSVITSLDRHSRQQLLLHGHAELPVVRPRAPTAENRVVESRPRPGPPEIQIGPRRRCQPSKTRRRRSRLPCAAPFNTSQSEKSPSIVPPWPGGIVETSSDGLALM